MFRTTKLHRLEENIGAVNVHLSPDDVRQLETTAAKIPVRGARYPEELMKPGRFVVGSFATSDNTCVICRDGYQRFGAAAGPAEVIPIRSAGKRVNHLALSIRGGAVH